MNVKLNIEFLKRHLFVTVLMFGMGCWFGYDGLVRYPATPAAELYRSIENADAPAQLDLEKFKTQKTQTQYGFMALAFLAAFLVGAHLWSCARFKLSFDDAGFTVGTTRYAYADVTAADYRQWTKKSIARLTLRDGRTIKLDAWHHTGVKDFIARLPPALRPKQPAA